ncbi:S-methyl-5-thioribose-1-phosphate isomerase [Hydrogenibacillus sp. N12]|uniref:S-methyl-5-thioribose-1-phosphate isomerase n=1 Tax=Hydrogenibacillus sp. N12 TaxID=2866627 RepID=UPI001C7DCB6E|nr:S-methyl-5-thioribose-1-phosphate isomerase [Hydrogenibacillus sp. N12]QZA32756.1 S-methyl-5-thioribose-1-phosphate isomerase [Hydrogenibacillus sp. N12]
MSAPQESYIRWENDRLILLDQTRLPQEKHFLALDSVEGVFEAIQKLRVRGAPAIGVAAAYGLVIGVREAPEASFDAFYNHLLKQKEFLAASRPTAVNLFWALDRLERKALSLRERPVREIKQALLQEARAIQDEDRAMTEAIGRHGLSLLQDGMGVLTHCNTGKLATAGIGTAVAPIYLAKAQGMKIRVFADETRPLLQGARLTAWELMDAGIDVTLITDSMAAVVMRRGWVDLVIVGADRIARNGDVANKIGTYGLALLAKAHGIPFYVAAPSSTIDLETATGDEIVIEERDPDEVRTCYGCRIAPAGVSVYNPAFDVTPHELVAGIITEKGMIRPPYSKTLPHLLER